jgi:hypothetical protein
MNLIEELSEAIKELEAKIPANPEKPENIRRRARFENDLAQYFQRLDQALSIEELERLYYRWVEQE